MPKRNKCMTLVKCNMMEIKEQEVTKISKPEAVDLMVSRMEILLSIQTWVGILIKIKSSNNFSVDLALVVKENLVNPIWEDLVDSKILISKT